MGSKSVRGGLKYSARNNMKAKSVLLGLALAMSGAVSWAQTANTASSTNFLWVTKSKLYTQTNNLMPAWDGFYRFGWNVVLATNAPAPTAISLTRNDGAVMPSLAGLTNFLSFSTNFPDGGYRFIITNSALGSNAIPVVLGQAGVVLASDALMPWFKNAELVRVTHPSNDLTLAWQPVAALASDRWQLTVLVAGKTNVVYQTPRFDQAGALAGSATSVVIPAATLTNGTYQVQLDFVAVTGGNVSVTNVAAYASYVFSTVMNIQRNPSAPLRNQSVAPATVSSQPVSALGVQGGYALFAVNAGGTAPLAYQWYREGLPLVDSPINTGANVIAGATNAVLLITNLDSTFNSNRFYVAVTNAGGGTVSSSALLSVATQTPVIVVQPTLGGLASSNVAVGTPIAITVLANSAGTMSYSWRLNGNALGNNGHSYGVTTSNLTILGLQTADAGAYDVVVANAFGSVTSAVVNLNPVTRILQLASATVTNGTLSVPVTLAAAGNETNVAFSVGFNPTFLKFVSFTTNGSISNLTVATNLTSGFAGVTLGLAGGQTFAAGVDILGTFLFQTNTLTNSRTLLLNLTNTPTVAAITDTNGALLPFGTQDAQVDINVPVAFAANQATNQGYFSEVLTVRNTSPVAWQGFEVLVSGLGLDSFGRQILLLNQAGTSNGVPYLLYPYPVLPGAAVDVNIEYFASDFKTQPTNRVLQVLQIFPETLTLTQPITGGTVAVTQANYDPARGAYFVFFRSAKNRTYYIQYSDDLVNWNTVVPSLAGTGYMLEWWDDGPPKTQTKPATVSSRFYRIITQ